MQQHLGLPAAGQARLKCVVVDGHFTDARRASLGQGTGFRGQVFIEHPAIQRAVAGVVLADEGVSGVLG
ncbi:hypothetical protein ACIRU3_41760 [Streptomyces sp. NPDC101151]|uniref:hypothetical protein n=1 Tax=Streptomyces sp. NPDC101151 TaxID=3366115 RepID=UPI00380AE966